jgi:Zn-dependent protease with chaperone function
MDNAPDFYPPAPPDVPPGLARPSASYRVRVLVVLTSLLAFALLYLGLVVGSGYLCYWSFASLGGSKAGAGRELFQRTSREEKNILTIFNRAQGEGLDDAALLRILERDVLPPWRDLRRRLDEVHGLPAAEQRLVEQYRRCFQLQEEGWELLCRAIRQRDADLLNQARARTQEAEQLERQLAAQASAYYGSRRPRDTGDSAVWLVLLGIASGVLCLFLVKGFFKRRRAEQSLRVEVTKKEQPVLFAFLRRLCRDTRAPLPRRVYLTAEVNAAVVYQASFWGLLLPTSKDLVVGLGLVNRLNLSEFKAVLAHEFGHFSQNSMKLGTYVYTSNRIIGDLVFGRDWLDDVVAFLRGVDIRIAVFAWAFTGVLWALRKALQGLFRAINFANTALSRQMEYNADLVAVSVTGSDALIHGLARLDFAADSLAQAWADLQAAADHKLFSRDLFYHQARAAEYLRAFRKDPRLGEPPALPEDPRQAVQVFPPEDTSVPRMWATHPSNHDREVNAKRHYVRSPLDGRPPWVLFADAAAVRERVTRQLYEATGRRPGLGLQDPEAVQAFIDEEHAESTYNARYQGLYDQRYLEPGSLDELIRAAPGALADADLLAEAHAGLYGDELRARMEAHQVRRGEHQLLARLAGGAVELTGKDFQFRGARREAAEARGLLDGVRKELEQDFNWMARLDRQAFLVHYAMARQVGEAVARDLEERYRFHLALQEIHGRLSGHEQGVRGTLARLGGKPQLTREEFDHVLGVFREAHRALQTALQAAVRLRFPALKNVTAGQPLHPFLLSQFMIEGPSGANGLDGAWVGQFLGQAGEVIDKAQRVLFKSLGGILTLQESIAERWAAPARTSAAALQADLGPDAVRQRDPSPPAALPGASP